MLCAAASTIHTHIARAVKSLQHALDTGQVCTCAFASLTGQLCMLRRSVASFSIGEKMVKG